MAFCDNCGHELRSTSKFCGSCGTKTSPTQDHSNYDDIDKISSNTTKQNVNSGNVLQRPPEWKSMGVTIVLTVVLGIFGFGGIGHLYLGKIIKGIVLCIVGIILLLFTIMTVLMGLVVLIPFALIVVYDAYRLCKRYNNDLEQTGRPPW